MRTQILKLILYSTGFKHFKVYVNKKISTIAQLWQYQSQIKNPSIRSIIDILYFTAFVSLLGEM